MLPCLPHCGSGLVERHVCVLLSDFGICDSLFGMHDGWILRVAMKQTARVRGVVGVRVHSVHMLWGVVSVEEATAFAIHGRGRCSGLGSLPHWNLLVLVAEETHGDS
jgi:uncharacterized membrane protein (Fun14 family)